MPTSTYTPLANITLGSAAASVTFSSISQSYRDLILVFNGSLPSAASLFMRLNNDSANHSVVRMYNSGAGSPASDTLSNWEIAYSNTTLFSKTEIMDYSATDKHKSSLIRWGNADGATSYTMALAGRWASTSAVTSIVLVTSSGNITAGSTFALYGVSA